MDAFPKWLTELDAADLAFMKQFILASGSLKQLAKVYGISYPTVRSRLDQCRQELLTGEGWISALRKTGILTGLSARMAAIGERTGTVAETMNTIAANAQEEADRRISGALGLIEPALVILLSVMVGIILLSVMFPLLGILSGM